MIKLTVFALSMTLFGCATAIQYTATERCAQDGMILTGISHGASVATGIAYNYRGGLTTASASGVSTNVQCSVPNNDEEKKQVSDIQRELVPKEEYNSRIDGKRFSTGLGYVLVIIPGIIAKIIYDGQLDDAVKKSNQIATGTSNVGIVRFSNNGDASEIKSRRDEASKKMSDICKGKYKVISEGINQGIRTTASEEYWYINFQCN